MSFFKRIFGKFIEFGNEKKLRKLYFYADQIDALQDEYASLSDEDLRGKTSLFKEKLAQGATLNDLIVPAFATVREASRRAIGIYPYRVQLIGGLALHDGMAAEMKTGEGKTLVAVLPSYLNALEGKGVHIVTVNDYLAKRDSDEMGQVYGFLALKTGCIKEGLSDYQRKIAYAADITYATNNQLGFDYLRDNMKFEESELCMRGLNYAIVDEADSVLIDEARTPLIISGQAEKSSDTYAWVDHIIRHISPKHYEKDEKMRIVTLNDVGIEKVEGMMRSEGVLSEGETLYDIEHISLVHGINQALKAHTLFARDVDYIVKDEKVMLIDEFTGRILDGRRYSDGLHQAIEAKERVPIQMENQTLASITFQKFFGLYSKVCGMSGTCATESEEFDEIYKLPVVVIPTHLQMQRKDEDDEIYRTLNEKIEAILKEVKEANAKGQPILIVTASVEMSEVFSSAFKANDLKHQVLNARYHEQEAKIIAEAGVPGAITIATNMAGRGTDIQLGGSLKNRIKVWQQEGLSDDEIDIKKQESIKEIAKQKEIALQAGGLYVIGTERNESRRVDNQARGRSGRQGDPGKSKFFLSLEDNLLRIFGSSEKLDKWLLRFGMKEGESITHPFISRAIEKAQQAVEARNFDWRKSVLKYDEVLDEQRKLIYKYRLKFIKGVDIEEQMKTFVDAEIVELSDFALPLEGEWILSTLHEECIRLFGLEISFPEWVEQKLTPQQAREKLKELILDKFQSIIAEEKKEYLQTIFLKNIDDLWKDHLSQLENLRQGIGLKAYGQKDPLNEYKKEAFNLFEALLNNFRENTISFFFHM